MLMMQRTAVSKNKSPRDCVNNPGAWPLTRSDMQDSTILFVEPSTRRTIPNDLAFSDPMFSRLRPATHCAYPECGDYGLYMLTPLCREHASIVWRIFEMNEPALHHEIVREKYKAEQQERAEKADRVRLTAKRPGYVYYVQVGDRIKIGFTTSVMDRMKAYPPTSVLLVYHPGTPDLEKEMHSKFRIFLAEGREWFRADDRISEHIAEINERYPMDPDEMPRQQNLKPAPKGKGWKRRL